MRRTTRLCVQQAFTHRDPSTQHMQGGNVVDKKFSRRSQAMLSKLFREGLRQGVERTRDWSEILMEERRRQGEKFDLTATLCLWVLGERGGGKRERLFALDALFHAVAGGGDYVFETESVLDNPSFQEAVRDVQNSPQSKRCAAVLLSRIATHIESSGESDITQNRGNAFSLRRQAVIINDDPDLDPLLRIALAKTCLSAKRGEAALEQLDLAEAYFQEKNTPVPVSLAVNKALALSSMRRFAECHDYIQKVKEGLPAEAVRYIDPLAKKAAELLQRSQLLCVTEAELKACKHLVVDFHSLIAFAVKGNILQGAIQKTDLKLVVLCALQELAAESDIEQISVVQRVGQEVPLESSGDAMHESLPALRSHTSMLSVLDARQGESMMLVTAQSTTAFQAEERKIPYALCKTLLDALMPHMIDETSADAGAVSQSGYNDQLIVAYGNDTIAGNMRRPGATFATANPPTLRKLETKRERLLNKMYLKEGLVRHLERMAPTHVEYLLNMKAN